MIVTKEEQTRLVANYIAQNEKVGKEKAESFVDGMEAMFNLIDKKMREEKGIYQTK